MRICLIATNGFTNDPRARASAHQLAEAGHEVVVVASGRPRPEASPFPITWVPTAQPPGNSLTTRLRRRIQSEERGRQAWRDRLAEAAAETGATMFHACSPAAVSVAEAAAHSSSGTVSRHPGWPDAGQFDLIGVAPRHPEANPTTTPAPLAHHTPDDTRPASRPEPGRHAGRRLAMIYRKTDTNPGRYLEDALRRAGVDVTVFTGDLNWDDVEDADAALFVESPPPAARITGRRPAIPVAFWAHHGEHHLAANLRLTRRFGADVVLLAHSWHLAHYFPVPVVRFPFGVPADLFDPSLPYLERPLDVAMVGAHLRGGGPYPFRHRLVTEIEGHLGTHRTAFEEGVPRIRMAELYARTKLIPNEGGVRHHPITMRVFEAIGAGAVLWTRPIPGLDLLFTPDVHYVAMKDDFISQLDTLLGAPDALAEIAASGTDHAAGHHTYDHRVDELWAALAALTIRPSPPAQPPPPDELVAWLDEDAEIQRILDGTDRRLADAMPDREIWTTEQVPDPHSASFTAAVVDDGTTNIDAVLSAARKYIYATGAKRELEAFVAEYAPHAQLEHRGPITRVDLLPAARHGTILP